MSASQLHTSPSVLLEMRLLAFCVPTIFIAYIGYVCPAADSGVFNTGRCFARVSHSRTCPEYDPPKMRVGWKGEKVTESTSD